MDTQKGDGGVARGRSPQEKKALSYARDRHDYGEKDKASRKAIRRRKRDVEDEVWVGLDHDAGNVLWAEFADRFQFRASINPDKWPAIVEPTLSVVWDLGPIFDGDYTGCRDVAALVLGTLQDCTDLQVGQVPGDNTRCTCTCSSTSPTYWTTLEITTSTTAIPAAQRVVVDIVDTPHGAGGNNRVDQFKVAQGSERPRALPERAGRPEVPLHGTDGLRPHRPRPWPVDHAMEGRAKRLRCQIRGPPGPSAGSNQSRLLTPST